MNKQNIIESTISFVKSTLSKVESGHDWWHVYRVWKMAKTIALKKETDIFIIELGALLHDIADSKFHDGNEEIGPKIAREFLQQQKLDKDTIAHIEQIIRNISFKGGNHKQAFKSIELDIIQDADRLDAIGAIGVARAFNYGGHKNREIYNPEIKPDLHMDKETYKKNTSPTINHFYEKLLLLKDRMNTSTGKEIAQKRHAYMEGFLKEFFKEWEGKI